MLKILILSHYFNPDVGGIETNSEILADAFHHFGAEVHVMTWTKQESTNKFPFKIIRNPGLNQIYKEHRWADVVFENNPCLRLSWPNIFIRKPLVVALNTWVNRINGNKALRDKLKQLWFRRASRIIAVSDAVRKKEWQEAVVIENPYNDTLFNIMPAVQKKIPFIFLGRLVSDKGADQAILAVAALADKNIIDRNSLQLTITGDGPERKNLISLREKLGLCGAVHFTGILKGKELVDCLNHHQYILVPSVWEEPYGNVVLEGMACGCIPIASDGGGMPEAVGDAGFVFARNDLDSMVHQVRSVLCEPQRSETIRNNARAHLDKHAVKLVAEKYFRILKEVAAANK